MKTIQAIFIVLLLSGLSCTEHVTDVPVSDPADHNMKIIPENPTSVDEINLVVYDDCTYNVLSGVKRNEKIIYIRKQFNSMMKWPCFPKNDTIPLGQLSEGTYTVNYKLADLSTQVKDSIALSLAFTLTVTR